MLLLKLYSSKKPSQDGCIKIKKMCCFQRDNVSATTDNFIYRACGLGKFRGFKSASRFVGFECSLWQRIRLESLLSLCPRTQISNYFKNFKIAAMKLPVANEL
jgi:hypothetical protein